jgi:hypothetical protein
MALYPGDVNKVAFIGESGTYGVGSTPIGTGQWIGLIQDHSPDESTGNTSIRYVGGATRNVSVFANGPLDYTGTLTYYPQDFKMVGFTLGSITDSSGLSSLHYMSETSMNAGNAFTSGIKAPFLSFTLEDSKTNGTASGLNFIRTYKGCMVDSFTLSASQGEPLTAEIGYMAQSVVFSSGATSTITAATTTPYLWNHTRIEIPSATAYDEVTAWSLSINNNLEPTHYCNGSREVYMPIPLNRDTEFTMTYQANGEKSKTLFDSYFIPGSEFNMKISAVQVSGVYSSGLCAYFALSGCKITSMSTPGAVEGISEHDCTITVKSVSVEDRSSIQKYNLW